MFYFFHLVPQDIVNFTVTSIGVTYMSLNYTYLDSDADGVYFTITSEHHEINFTSSQLTSNFNITTLVPDTLYTVTSYGYADMLGVGFTKLVEMKGK